MGNILVPVLDPVMTKVAETLSRWDGLAALLIVVFVELVVKKLICKSQEGKIFKIIYTLAPVVIGALAYVAAAYIFKKDVVSMLKNGLAMGGCASWFYNALWAFASGKAKDKEIETAGDIGQGALDIMKGGKNEKK